MRTFLPRQTGLVAAQAMIGQPEANNFSFLGRARGQSSHAAIQTGALGDTFPATQARKHVGGGNNLDGPSVQLEHDIKWPFM